MDKPRITIAIDGFSSCGKSTMAKALARRIGYIYIDSGAMYRAVTLYCLDHNLIDGDTVDTEALRSRMDDIHIDFRPDPPRARPTPSSTAGTWSRRFAPCGYRTR